MLQTCNARYMTAGLESLKSLEGESVDFVFSQAVLEHIRKHEFLETMHECRRILKPNGVASHTVGLKDHLGGGLNNLRFSESLWESSFFVQSGFYTNRIRFSPMLSLMRDAGFVVDVLEVDRWEQCPIQRSQLDVFFCDLSNNDLLINGFDVLLKLP